MVATIPQVTNWSVTPQNGQVGYFTLMNTWLFESTTVINSLKTAIDKMNEAGEDINNIGQNAINAITFDNIAQLKLNSNMGRVDVLGYYTKGDGGGGTFYWDSTSTETDNSGSIIQAIGLATGRWKRVYIGAVSVKWFGAKGNGAIDDTAAIQKALDNSNHVIIPSGIFIITSSLSILSNKSIAGIGNSSVIKMKANNFAAFSFYSSIYKENIIIKNLLIDGGGQTENIFTGYKGNTGIKGSYINNIRIDNVKIINMGIVDISNYQNDNGFGGYGISIESRLGEVSNVIISRCHVSKIAGGGMYSGDGIYIAGFRAGGETIEYANVVIDSCFVSTCGRHCYTIAGGAGESIPAGIKIVNSYGEKSSLDGLDIEEGHDVVIDNTTFSYCGNDQTYYNPVVAFGATYRLLAGIACGSNSKNIIINNCKFNYCYFGISEAGTNVKISNSTFDASISQDLIRGLASSTLFLTLVNCVFNSENGSVNPFYNSLNSKFKATDCYFNFPFKITSMTGGTFLNCNFKKGVEFTGTGSTKIKFDSCTFDSLIGNGIKADGANYNITNCTVTNCLFDGNGSMTNGIIFGYNSALNWSIIGNTFSGLTNSGIYSSNSNAKHVFDAQNNNFINSVNGIVSIQAICNCIISGNVFTSISTACISISGIISGANMIRTNITNNTSGENCVNGVFVIVSSGAWNYCIVTNNNFNSCTGSKWTLSTGNANGFTINNITT